MQKAIEVRGLKIKVVDLPIPVPYGPAFEGERVRKEDTWAEAGGQRSTAFEFVRTLDASEVTDGKIEVIGPELDELEAGTRVPLGIVVDVAGRKMQSDFEPVIERQFHHLMNFAEGVLHMGQRELIWIRISQAAKDKGFKFHHLGDILHAKILDEFDAIVDKVQVTIYTEQAKVEEMLEVAKKTYDARDERMAQLTDDTADVFYSCSLCQSFAPSHICVVTPERLGLCGAYNWLDAKASNQLNPTGPNQPIEKGAVISTLTGEWEGVNDFIKREVGRRRRADDLLLAHGQPDDELRLLHGDHRAHADVQRRHDRQPRVPRHDPVGHEVLDARRHGRRRRAGSRLHGHRPRLHREQEVHVGRGRPVARRVDAQGAQGGHAQPRSRRASRRWATRASSTRSVTRRSPRPRTRSSSSSRR